MLQTCNSEMQCGGYWSNPVISNGPNFHYEETALELIIAYKHSISGLEPDNTFPRASISNKGVASVSPSWVGIVVFYVLNNL
jgi:hypothetical protein